MVLQRRRLYKQPLEYLVKYRGNASKYREIWIPQATLAEMDKGPSLIRAFKKTKVGQMGVDAHLGKRRSLMRRSAAEARGEAASSTALVSDDILMAAANSSAGKLKNSSKTASINNSSRSSDAGSKPASVRSEKSKSSASKFGAQHDKNKHAAFLRHAFGNHRTKTLKQHSSLRHGAPSLRAKKRTFAQSKQPKRHNSKTVQSEISSANMSNNGSKVSQAVGNISYDDELVSISSESSGDGVRYSLAGEHDGPSGNGRHRTGGCSELGQKSKAAGNPSKKLRLSDTDTESVRSDSEINFKHSPSNSLKNQQKFRLEQGLCCCFGLFY